MWMSLVYLLFLLAALAGLWRVFEKLGRAGWEGIIPIWNLLVVLQLVHRPVWWVVLFLLPIVNLVIGIIVCMEFARLFGRSPAFGVGLALLGFVFYPILGFGKAEYHGPTGAEATPLTPPLGHGHNAPPHPSA
jgi:hypothetical protein